MASSALNPRWVFVVASIVLVGVSACKEAGPVSAEPDAYSQMVSADGAISFPADFPNGFMFIGSWAVAGDEGVADIHSVYARPSDVEAFKQAGKFPDGAVLIKEVSSTRGATHTTGEAFWPDQTKTWFMMIKDTQGRFDSNPLWGDGMGLGAVRSEGSVTSDCNGLQGGLPSLSYAGEGFGLDLYLRLPGAWPQGSGQYPKRCNRRCNGRRGCWPQNRRGGGV